MIVPSGKRRTQIAQGPCQNESIFDKLFEKVAIAVEGTPGGAPAAAPAPGKTDLSRGLEQALGPGSSSPGISGNAPQQMGDLQPEDDVGLGQDGIEPAGGPSEGMNQRGLRASPIEEGAQQQSTIQQAIPQLSQYLEGKSLELKATPADKNGVLEFLVGANQMSQLPQTVNLQNTNEEAADMAKLLGGSIPPDQLSWYDSNSGYAHIYIQMGSPTVGPVVQKQKGRR